jgi:hypothetical protein
MGLGMLLYRANLHGHSVNQARLVENYLELQRWNEAHPDKVFSLMQWSNQNAAEIDPQALQDLRQEFKLRYLHSDHRKVYGHYQIFENCGIWHGATAIHDWFVRNLQDEVDNCEYSIVTRKQLEQLKELCKTVLSQVKVEVVPFIVNADGENDILQLIPGNTKVITNPEVCQAMLPTSEYHHGTTDYGESYLDDLEDTVKIITNVLAQTNWDSETILYCASW